jgi:hypothetical protein
MADPVETADLGTASETAVEDIVAESATDADIGGSNGDTSDTADGETEIAATAHTDTVKYSRFKSVNDRRIAAEQKAAVLEAQLAALQPKTEQPKPKGLRERLKQGFQAAPADMSPLEQFQYYGLQAVEQHMPELLDQWFEGKFGTKPEAAAATLAHSAVFTRENIVRQFTEAATSHGLDPKNEGLRVAVGALMDTGKFRTFADAMDAFKPQAAPKPAPQHRRVNGGTEIESVDVTGLSRVSSLPRNAKEAGALAAKGKAAPHESVSDILKAFAK